MSNDARNCATGCTSLGRHLSHCDSPDDQCRGCMPREAVDGLLCARCWGNLQRDVRTAPSIVDWIREHVEPSAQWGERVNSREIDAPAPLTVTAVDDADGLHSMLASWALLILEEHPSALSRPKLERQWRTQDGTVVGLLPDSSATTGLCRFIDRHAEWASEQPWVGEMVTEIGRVVRTLLARYPQAERARHMPQVLCPACGRSSMVYFPPAWVGSQVLVQCEHASCGEKVPEDRYGHFMRLVEQQRKEAS
jgi:hypothetical protein